MPDQISKLAEASRTTARALTRLGQIMSGRPTKDAVWPGSDLRMKLRLLSDDDVQLCNAAAVVRFTGLGLPLDSMLVAALFEDECMVQLLSRACRDFDDPAKPLAESADDMRTNTTGMQRAAAFHLYRDFVAETDPDPGQMTPEVEAELLSLVKKKDVARLRSFGSCTLASFLLSMDDQLSI